MRIPFVAALAAVSAFAEVKVFPSNKHDVRKFSTYQWQRPPRLITEMGQDDTTTPLVDTIKSAIDRRLSEKGYREVREGGDMQVVAGAVAGKQSQLEGYLVTFGFDAYWGYWFGMPYPVQRMNRIGLLFVGLVEAQSNEGIWAGYATEALDRKPGNLAGTSAKAERATRKLFRKLPGRK
jgi:hypothetical protein